MEPNFAYNNELVDVCCFYHQVDMECKSSDPSAQYSWSTSSGDLPENSATNGPLLRIYDFESSNSVQYTCTITTASGSSYSTHTLLAGGVSIHLII